jgi:protein-tyrosine phosphatase
MLLRRLDLPAEVSGRLWLSAMPGRFAPWPGFLREATEVGLTRVVCLAPLEEVQRLSPEYYRAIHGDTLPCRWTALPMRDFGVPDEAQEFRRGVIDLVAALRSGEVALLHCAAGIGRTGTTAACVLKALGLPSAEALRQVRLAGSNPESADQSGLIDGF